MANEPDGWVHSIDRCVFEHWPSPLTIVFAALAVSRAIQMRTGLSIAKVVKLLRPLRSATIHINGATQTFPPEIPDPERKILDDLGFKPGTRQNVQTQVRRAGLFTIHQGNRSHLKFDPNYYLRRLDVATMVLQPRNFGDSAQTDDRHAQRNVPTRSGDRAASALAI